MKKCKRTILFVISILMMSLIAGCGFGEVEIKINSDEDKNYHEILTPTRGIDAHKDGIDTQLQPCSNDIVRTVINAYYNALV